MSQKLLAAVLAVLLTGLGLEAIIRVEAALPVPVAVVSGPVVEPMLTEDRINGAKPNPKYWDHDAAGWRNEEALGRVDVLALGDSQTYGIGADRQHSWPAQLDRMLDASVYQMALGGYNPTTFLRLGPEVLQHHPKVVVLSIYFGANFSQAYDETYKRAEHPELLPFRTTEPSLLAKFQQAERLDGETWIRSRYLDCQRPEQAPNPALLTIENILDAPDLAPLTMVRTLADDVASVSAIFAELRRRVTAARVSDTRPALLAEPWCLPYSTAGIETILTPAYRLLNLETTDPRIVEGERIVIEATKRLREILQEVGAQLFVVLIPTKELAFEFDANEADPSLRYLTRIWALESAAHRRVSDALEGAGIPVIDPLPALQSMISRGIDPYLGRDGNGHPSQIGYKAIAETVADAIEGAL